MTTQTDAWEVNSPEKWEDIDGFRGLYQISSQGEKNNGHHLC